MLTAAAGLATSALVRPALAARRSLKIGYVSPQTGALAPFGEADVFILRWVRESLINGVRGRPVEILVRDGRSDPAHAAEAAAALIKAHKVGLMLVSGTAETVNPVTEVCERERIPCLSTATPWQSWMQAGSGSPEYGFHFFWGLEDLAAVYAAMWTAVTGSTVVGGLFPPDLDGTAWSGALPSLLATHGYKLTAAERFDGGREDTAAAVSRFKAAKAEIVTGVMLPLDWNSFWSEARRQGFRPHAASIGKALLFPAGVEALARGADGLSTEVWWSPTHPFVSSLTGSSARELARGYEAATERQWTQLIGFVHALFELAADALKRAADPTDAQAVRAAIAATRLDTVVGPIDWTKGPAPNVARTPLVGGQWRPGGRFRYELVVTSNAGQPTIPVAGPTLPIAG